MINVIIIGAAGRMGRRLVSQITQAEDMQLAGAVEHPECPALGQDAGSLAGEAPCGVDITSTLQPLLEVADLVIDFSTGSVVENAKLATEANVAAVIGTTALDESQQRELANFADNNNGRIVFAPNMSVGVNLLFKLTEDVARLLGDEYDIEIVEMHHRHKKDSPSGTAVRLGQAAAEGRSLAYAQTAVHGRQGIVGERPVNEIGMHAVRGGDVVGDHTVIYASEGERIELTHKASSRDTFAKGALRAARFICNAKPGLYDMQDVLGIK